LLLTTSLLLRSHLLLSSWAGVNIFMLLHETTRPLNRLPSWFLVGF
jgi:hypothetical protein